MLYEVITTDSSILEKDFLFIVTDKELSGKELNDKLNEDNYRNIILITNDLINVAKGFNNNRKPDVIISALNPSDLVWEYLIEGLFSSFKINGKQTLPNSLIAVDYKLAILPKLRLGHSFPIEEGLNPDSLNKIDEIIKEAIRITSYNVCYTKLLRKISCHFICTCLATRNSNVH